MAVRTELKLGAWMLCSSLDSPGVCVYRAALHLAPQRAPLPAPATPPRPSPPTQSRCVPQTIPIMTSLVCVDQRACPPTPGGVPTCSPCPSSQSSCMHLTCMHLKSYPRLCSGCTSAAVRYPADFRNTPVRYFHLIAGGSASARAARAAGKCAARRDIRRPSLIANEARRFDGLAAMLFTVI